MKSVYAVLLLAVLACKTKKENLQDQEVVDKSEDQNQQTEEQTWDYTDLYGQYVHENNTKGFSAILILEPQGHDLAFTLHLTQANCEATVAGNIGMMYHGETGYAGFFDDPACRLSFTFFLIEHQIRIEEIGICRSHALGCSFGGLYLKRKPTG